MLIPHPTRKERVSVCSPPNGAAARASWQIDGTASSAPPRPDPVNRPIDETPSRFGRLTRSIIHQQVSIAAGRAIGARFLAVSGGTWTAEAGCGFRLRNAGGWPVRAKAGVIAALAEADVRGDLVDIEAESPTRRPSLDW